MTDRVYGSLVQEQDAPKPNQGTAVWDLVIQDMQERDKVGRERYGTPLQTGNGRDHLVDHYQELLDAVVYARAEIEERNQQISEQIKEDAAIVQGFKARDPNSFVARFDDVVHEATSIVLQRDSEGRNAEVGVRDQFESTVSVLDMISMKLKRARSYLAAGNFAKFKEEMLDCLNYSGFVVVFEGEDEQAKLVQKAHEVLSEVQPVVEGHDACCEDPDTCMKTVLNREGDTFDPNTASFTLPVGSYVEPCFNRGHRSGLHPHVHGEGNLILAAIKASGSVR